MSKSLKSSILACILLLVLALSARATYVPYSPQNFNDELFWLYDNGDATKKLQFELDAITTGNTRTIIIGDADGNTADWNTAYGWGDHGSGGYLKADGSVTVTGAMTHNVGADTNYIELNPGAGNYARIDSNGEMWLEAAEQIDITAGAGTQMSFGAGADFLWTDSDTGYVTRMALDSATGNLTMGGTLAGCTQLTVDSIDLNTNAIDFTGNGLLVSSANIYIKTDGDTDDYISFEIVNADVPRITTSGTCNLEIFASGGNILTSNENLTGTGDLSYDELTLTNGQDYKFSRRSTNFMTLQSQSPGTANGFEFFSKDGDSTDDVTMTYWLLGTPGSVGTSEYCQIKFDASDDEFRVFTESVGEASARTMAFYAENANYHQLDLLANGDVKSLTSYTNTVGGTNHALFIDNTGKIGEEPSALRFKENIRPIEHSERIYQMEPVTYDRKDGSAYDQVGLIAEEVAVIWPELAIYKTERILEERPDEMDPNTTDNYLVGYREMDILSGIRSERLIFPLIEEMKKLRARVEELEARVEKLEGP